MFGPGSQIGGWFYLNNNLIPDLASDAFDDVTFEYITLDGNSLVAYPKALNAQDLRLV